MTLNPFEMEGTWVKGNLHCHTTESDGRFSPKEVVERYKAGGYDFLAITDHDRMTIFETDELLLIPGVEIAMSRSKLGESFHVIILGLEDIGSLDELKKMEIDDLLGNVLSRGGFAFIAHPYWSGLTTNDLLTIENLSAIEVFNSTCDNVGKGYSTVYWDVLLSQGSDVKGLAVDDTHRYDLPPRDLMRGWVWVKVKENDLTNIVDSLRKGLYYSSMGPEIYYFSAKNNNIEAVFSPVLRANLITRNGKGFSIKVDDLDQFEKGGYEELDLEIYQENDNVKAYAIGRYNIEIKRRNSGIISVRAPLSSFEKYVRLEILDIFGRFAWSNPMFI